VAKLDAEKSASLKSTLTALVSEHLGKPTQFVCVVIVTGQDMAFNGTEVSQFQEQVQDDRDVQDPCGVASLSSIGGLGTEENKAFAAKVFPLLQSALAIQADRCYINFSDLERANVGWNGSTFHK